MSFICRPRTSASRASNAERPPSNAYERNSRAGTPGRPKSAISNASDELQKLADDEETDQLRELKSVSTVDYEKHHISLIIKHDTYSTYTQIILLGFVTFGSLVFSTDFVNFQLSHS